MPLVRDSEPALLAGVEFLELTASSPLHEAGLRAWFDQYVVAAKLMPLRPSAVLEPSVGTIPLQSSSGTNADLPRVLSAARRRVLEALRGLLDEQVDDRFVRAAIFLGRVRREEGRWRVRLQPDAPLSGIVLTFFAIAALEDKEAFVSRLCVCDTCGRVTFSTAPPPGMRRACVLHPPPRAAPRS